MFNIAILSAEYEARRRGGWPRHYVKYDDPEVFQKEVLMGWLRDDLPGLEQDVERIREERRVGASSPVGQSTDDAVILAEHDRWLGELEEVTQEIAAYPPKSRSQKRQRQLGYMAFLIKRLGTSRQHKKEISEAIVQALRGIRGSEPPEFHYPRLGDMKVELAAGLALYNLAGERSGNEQVPLKKSATTPTVQRVEEILEGLLVLRKHNPRLLRQIVATNKVPASALDARSDMETLLEYKLIKRTGALGNHVKGVMDSSVSIDKGKIVLTSPIAPVDQAMLVLEEIARISGKDPEHILKILVEDILSKKLNDKQIGEDLSDVLELLDIKKMKPAVPKYLRTAPILGLITERIFETLLAHMAEDEVMDMLAEGLQLDEVTSLGLKEVHSIKRLAGQVETPSRASGIMRGLVKAKRELIAGMPDSFKKARILKSLLDKIPDNKVFTVEDVMGVIVFTNMLRPPNLRLVEGEVLWFLDGFVGDGFLIQVTGPDNTERWKIKNRKILDAEFSAGMKKGIRDMVDWTLSLVAEEIPKGDHAMMGNDAKGDNASSPLTEKTPGGIDLNPNNLDLQTNGNSFDVQLPFNSIDLQNIRIDGFTPVIIHVAPLTNLPLLLGLVEETQDTENVRITPGRDPMDHKMEYVVEIAS